MSPDGSAEVRRLMESGPEIQPRLHQFSVADFLQLDLPPRELLIDPILPKKGLAMLHAYRGIGKTHLALAIGYCAASGGKLFNTWSAPQPRRVLYLDGEMPAGAMQERLAAIVAGFEAQPPDPGYFMMLSADQIEDGLPDLGTDEGRAEIDAAAARAMADLIIVDNCSTLIRTGKENEGDSWLSVQSWALTHRRCGRSILFVHHDGKGGQQ